MLTPPTFTDLSSPLLNHLHHLRRKILHLCHVLKENLLHVSKKFVPWQMFPRLVPHSCQCNERINQQSEELSKNLLCVLLGVGPLLGLPGKVEVARYQARLIPPALIRSWFRLSGKRQPLALPIEWLILQLASAMVERQGFLNRINLVDKGYRYIIHQP